MMSNVDPPLKSSSMTYLINLEIKRVVLLLVVRKEGGREGGREGGGGSFTRVCHIF